MEKRKYTYAQLGMLFGIFIGGSVGTWLFAMTNNPIFFSVTGLGLVIGLLIGTAKDRQEEQKQDK